MPKPPHYRPIITEDEAVMALPRTIPRTKPTPIPTPSIFDEPTYCLKVNKEWAGHFLGVILIGLNQPDTWKPDGTHDVEWARNQIVEWVAKFLTENDCMPCCDDLVEQLTTLVEINTTMLTNITTIVTNLTTVINNQVTQIDNSQTIIDNSETVINQNDENLITIATNIYNNQVISNQNVNIYNTALYDGTPQSISPNLGANFNSTGGDDVLCGAVKGYIDKIINDYTTRVNLQALGFAILSGAAAALFSIVTGGAGLPAAVAWGMLSNTAVTGSAGLWNAISNDESAKRKVYCCMFDSLKDQPITLEIFKDAVLDCGFDPTSFAGRIAGLIQNESSDGNYLAFLRGLGQTQGNANDCECCDDIDDYEIVAVNAGTSVTKIDSTHYHVQSSTYIVEDKGGIAGMTREFTAIVKEVNDRCVTYIGSTQAQHDYFVTDCTGMDFSGTGGGGGSLTQFGWHFWRPDPDAEEVMLDTILEIACPE